MVRLDMTKTTITHEGSQHTFKCSLTTWKLYEDLIRLYCSGRVVQELVQGEWKDVDQIVESQLHLYRVKPKKAFLEGGYYATRK